MPSSESGAVQPHVVHEGTVTSVDIADDASVEKLRSGSIGLLLVLFLCVTGSAPLAVFMFNFPFVVGAGNEKYAPAAFFFATIILTIFSVAYVQMARKIRAAGGMFTYVSHGLGRTLGTGVRPLARRGVHALRRVADRRLRRLRAGEGRVRVRHGSDQLDLVRDPRHHRHLGAGVLRHPHLGQDPRRLPDLRAVHHHRVHDRRVHPGRQRRRLDRPGPAVERVQGNRVRPRHLHRLLVVGGIRGSTQLRRGVEESAPDDPDRGLRVLCVRRRPLHPRLVGVGQLVRACQSGIRRALGWIDDRLRGRDRGRLPQLQRRAGERAHRHLAGAADVGLHHHGGLRVCRSPEQRRASLHVLARARGAPP